MIQRVLGGEPRVAGDQEKSSICSNEGEALELGSRLPEPESARQLHRVRAPQGMSKDQRHGLIDNDGG